MKIQAAQTQKKIIISLALLLGIIIVGTSGFMIIEGFTLIEAVYMTFITISTVGFKEVHELSDTGRVFTIMLIVSSLGIVLYSFTILAAHIIEGEFRHYIRGQIRKSGLKKMKNHVIVCGYGRNGKQACSELKAYNVPYVVIDNKRENIADPADSAVLFVEGDATEDDVLIKAGVLNARALITSLSIDADNLFVVLSARSLNPKLIIISRASNETTEHKLKVAGVDKVVMPEKVGGGHMASLVVQPDIIEFLDCISIQGKDENNLVEITCSDLGKGFINQTIRDLNIHVKTGANIIGYKDHDGNFIINPSSETRLICGSKIFVLGTPAQINKMKELLKSESS
jgi:voltage-gated potassium channel